MKILCLFNNPCAIELFDWLREQGHETILWSDKLDKSWCADKCFDLTISYTYRHILTKEIITGLDDNIVNLHNSYLPFNRGADPNIWSLLDDTPRGVTLHYIDIELDKGDIIAQRFVVDGESETLRSSYDNLDIAAKELFKEAFTYYRFWPEMRKKAIGKGDYHSIMDGRKYRDMICSYEMPVSDFKRAVIDILPFKGDYKL